MIDYPPRTAIVEYMRSVLYGPRDGEAEEISGTPFLRYMSGILFPSGLSVDRGGDTVVASADEEAPSADIGGEEGEQERGLELAFEMLQAAVGLSFRVGEHCAITCAAWGACYEQAGEMPGEQARGRPRGRAGKRWRRRALATTAAPEVIRLAPGSPPVPIFGGRAHVEARWRPRGDGTAIVTVTMVNMQGEAKSTGLDPALALFQVGLRCSAVDQGILPYPEVGTDHAPDSEENEVAFLYRHSKPYARGHGAAATWGSAQADGAPWVEIDFMPSVDVPAATFELADISVDNRCVDIDFLSSAPRSEVLGALSTLPAAYDDWIAGHEAATVEPRFVKVAERFVERAKAWRDRMELGLKLLETDDDAWYAFHLANKAMGMQMVMAAEAHGGPFELAAARPMPRFILAGKRWRPFQVAFMLATVESCWDEASAHRQTVDVIWFPTGGGKTEAYLFVAALELVRRRLVHGEADTATAVMSRYTLRMLTAQQFQRTAALVVALELLRRENADRLGARTFSLGLWVGGGLTPNRFRDAHELLEEKLGTARPENPFQLQACPCCGTAIFPSKPTGRPGSWRMHEFGIVSTQGSFRFYCPNKRCAFHAVLPLSVVDEALYESPPSILLGTLDKFAQLPWDARSRVFFGGTDDRSPPPSLVLQDELHLISGPLGSISAPYEAAIETVLRRRGGIPKRIASTATIRNAEDQIRGLYGRQCAVFPSPCGSWDDAFFFSTDRQRPGRKYVGVMGQGYTKPVVAMSWAAAALLQAPMEVPMAERDVDAYWTVLAYHNSRRELGRTLTAARDEVATRIKVIASDGAPIRELREPMELSSQMVKSMSEALDALNRRHSAARPAVDFVPCTSIVSVGVDVGRLGAMLVNGQPKLTSEYIQATSRVGRDKVPGLVITLFSPSKPRDRSHYEDFRGYHESIYRHVEPTSVTPYALPARERTFHAALVALVRHGLQWADAADAGKVDFADPATVSAVAQLVELMCIADPAEAVALRELAQVRIGEWNDLIEGTAGNLHYESLRAPMQFRALLYKYGGLQAGALWPTMNSVRNVDSETMIDIG
ncbi:MAG: helicase domain protein [Nevskia sp.]|nr:helicase domain protein [Nevskia sp.]